ncbi:MAG: hypothetical protein PHU07_02170 [Acidocella sp.]|nr:hypothetical protein [Acidocella sp.]
MSILSFNMSGGSQPPGDHNKLFAVLAVIAVLVTVAFFVGVTAEHFTACPLGSAHG